jgi:hypothetical protein
MPVKAKINAMPVGCESARDNRLFTCTDWLEFEDDIYKYLDSE